MKTIIITGANGNLGSAVTKKFLDSGYQVIATVHSDADKNTMPVHPQLDIRVVNLANADESAVFVQSVIDQYKQVHCALMLVGGFAPGKIESTITADISKMVTLNFETAYNVTRPIFAHMQALGYGRLIFIGSRPAIKAAECKSAVAYGLSKSLLFTLAEYLNAEAKNTNVVATVVVPSTLDTPQNRKNMPDVNPDKWVKPEQLADVLEFVCGDKGSALRETMLKVYNNA